MLKSILSLSAVRIIWCACILKTYIAFSITSICLLSWCFPVTQLLLPTIPICYHSFHPIVHHHPIMLFRTPASDTLLGFCFYHFAFFDKWFFSFYCALAFFLLVTTLLQIISLIHVSSNKWHLHWLHPSAQFKSNLVKSFQKLQALLLWFNLHLFQFITTWCSLYPIKIK